MKTLIARKNFGSPYPTLSPNAPEAKILDCVWRMQDMNLRDILGDKFYTEFMRVYELEKVLNGVTVGSTTVLALADVDDLQVGSYLSLKGLVGTIADIANGLQFEVKNITGLNVTIALNSTGKTWTSGGIAERIFTPNNKVLFAYIEPYLVYGSYANYVPIAPLESTASGLMQHSVGEASHPTDKRIGEVVNSYTETARTYGQRIVDFLNNNLALYPLFQTAVGPAENSNPTFFKGKTPCLGNLM